MVSFSSKEDENDVTLKVIKKLISQVPDGPLENVEEISISEQLSPVLQPTDHKQKSLKRGPKSPGSWYSEIRKDWGNLDDVDKLGRSWLASLPEVLELATSKYEGGVIGKGRALKEVLTQALVEAKQCETDKKTYAILNKFPKMKIREIAAACGIDRSTLSRDYVSKATVILTETSQLVIGHKSKSGG